MRFGFVTCVQLGLDCLEELAACGANIALAVTLHDALATRKSGRIYIDRFCEERSVPLVKTKNVNENHVSAAIRAADVDWLFIVGWSQIAGRTVLDAPRRGALGIHPTLLPEGRGRAAIPWAILKGLTMTGVTLFRLDEGIDTGPILEQVMILVEDRENAGSLYAKVCSAHREVIRRAFPLLESGEATFRQQDDSQATMWPQRTPEDGRIDSRMTVREIDRLVRAVTRPYPGAFIEDGKTLVRIWAGDPERRNNDPASNPGYRVLASDGIYVAREFEIEQEVLQRA